MKKLVNQLKDGFSIMMTYIALGLARSMKAVSWGYIVTKFPFFKVTFLSMTSLPSSKYKLFIIYRHDANKYIINNDIGDTFGQFSLSVYFPNTVCYTYPIRQIAKALLSRELEDTAVGLLGHLRVANHKYHGI